MQKCITPLTDFQWQYIEKIVDNGRQRKTCLRMIVDALLYINRTGIQWRNIDSKYRSKMPIIQYYFYKWQADNTWKKVLTFLVEQFRIEMGCAPQPSMIAIDSQSIKLVSFIKEDKGIDANKRINGRKRHLIVDKLGLPLAISVSGADAHDGIEGIELLWQQQTNSQLELIRADNSYKGEFVKAANIYGWKVEFGQKPESQKGFIPQKGRWQVERSFSWLSFYRRLNKDYEKTAQSAVCFIQLAFINIILARLQRFKT